MKNNESCESSGSAISIFLEPAPYMVALASELCDLWPNKFDTYYVYGSLTQDWGKAEGRNQVLPPSRIAASVQVIRALIDRKPDLVLVAGWQNIVVVMTILTSRLLGATVISVSDTWVSDSGFLRTGLKKLILGCISHFAPGGSPQRDYLQSLGVDVGRITVTNMTVDARPIVEFRKTCTGESRRENRAKYGFDDKDIVFIFVGRLSEEKGVELMLDAFRILETEHAQVKMLVVGGEVDYNIKALEEVASRNVVFTGRLSGEQLYCAFSSADVFIGASLNEGWGLAVNEAMMFGLPVIVADCYGCAPDLVDGKNTGIVSSTGSAKSFADAMLKLASNESLRAEFGENGAKLISHWTIKAQAKRIIEGWQKARRSRA